jgi:preprotein translocase subunit SecD
MKNEQISRSKHWNLGRIATGLTLVISTLNLSSCNALSNLISSNIKSSIICPYKGIELTLEVEPYKKANPLTPEIVEGVRKVMAKRLDNLGIKNSSVVKISNTQILVQVPDEADPISVERSLESSGLLEFREQRQGTEALFRIEQLGLTELETTKVQAMAKNDNKTLKELQKKIQESKKAIATLFRPAELTGEHLIDAYGTPITENSQTWSIAIKFDNTDSKKFKNLTKKIAGTGRAIGIFIDNHLISAPMVGSQYAKSGITGGSAVISGIFDSKSANEVAIQLRSGALPATAKVRNVLTAKRTNCETSKNQ